MPQLAFFPWIRLENDLDVGDYSLQRFAAGDQPGPDAQSQETLDAVLAPYYDLCGKPVETAVILTARDRAATDELSEEDRAELFQFAELFAFAALADRAFFTPDYYYNRDQLRLVIQEFADPQGGAFIVGRRRDGRQGSYLTRDRYSVQVPVHVHPTGQRITLDVALLKALLDARGTQVWPDLYQGIILFNQANTDAPDVSQAIELMLTYAAMERILECASSQGQEPFGTRFAEAWCPSQCIPRSEWRAPPTKRRWNGKSLRACWAFDLHVLRGSLAHGHRDDRFPSQWSADAHLLLTSFAVPRLVKRILSCEGHYKPTELDGHDIDVFEHLLNREDLFARADPAQDVMGLGPQTYGWNQLVPRREHRPLIELMRGIGPFPYQRDVEDP